MANNRLYLVDGETGEKILLAKSFGMGWQISRPADELSEWLEQRDVAASYGNAAGPGTTLGLVAENDNGPKSATREG
jgi:hypothetical protein